MFWSKMSLKIQLKVVITDLGEIGENAIVVFEEAVGVGAEEIVCGQVLTIFTLFLHSWIASCRLSEVMIYHLEDDQRNVF